MQICVGNLTFIGSDNGLSPGRRQAIVQTNARISSIGLSEQTSANFFNEIHHAFSFKEMLLKMHLRNGDNVVSAAMC